eukprot:COSAG05_NODE_4486_length_1493_cov_2.191535_1_plen_375_part_10
MLQLLQLLALLAPLGHALSAPPHPHANATASPSRLSIEFGGDLTVVHRGSSPLPPPAAATALGSETCTLTRLYGSGGFGLTHQKLGPDFKHCCTFTTPATRLNRSAVRCHLPAAVIATEGNTTVSTSVGFAYLRSYAAFAPEFSRRPYYREANGAVIVRIADVTAAEHGPLLFSATLPCGLPPITAVELAGQHPPTGHFATYRLSFPLGGDTAASCYEAVNLTLHGPNLPSSVVRTRTFIRAPPPKLLSTQEQQQQQEEAGGSRRFMMPTAWAVDHESRGLLVDGRRFIAQGWFAGGYAHESVGLPAITRGETMHMNDIRHLGQASVVTEWGRQGHSFVRYGIGSADDVDFKNQTKILLETLDAAAAAGMYVLIN